MELIITDKFQKIMKDLETLVLIIYDETLDSNIEFDVVVENNKRIIRVLIKKKFESINAEGWGEIYGGIVEYATELEAKNIGFLLPYIENLDWKCIEVIVHTLRNFTRIRYVTTINNIYLICDNDGYFEIALKAMSI